MRAGVSSGRQLAFRVHRFRTSSSASGLVKAELQIRGDRSADEVVDEVMDWLRTWASFEFPRYLRTVENIQRSVFTRLERRPGNYTFFSGQIENWFLDPAIMALDEYGIPVQVGQKLSGVLHAEGDLDAVLQRLKGLEVRQLSLSSFEKSLVTEAQKYI
jgi:hypothetical protein